MIIQGRPTPHTHIQPHQWKPLAETILNDMAELKFILKNNQNM